MSRRDNAHNRCQGCGLHESLCLCQELPRLSTASKLCLVIHRDELRKPTNTGRLATRCLGESRLLVHGEIGMRAGSPIAPQENLQPLLLYPGSEAEPLAAKHRDAGPVLLVVPDGTWRQAAKMSRRIEWMAELPRVGLPEGELTAYRLRSEPKEGGLATMEAIARAFGILEGPAVQEELESIFRKMVDRTLYSRGLISRDQVFGGVPEGTMRHEPRRI